MANNFLIALGTALASTSVILLVLRFGLKLFAPDAFKEMLPGPNRVADALEALDAVVAPANAPARVPAFLLQSLASGQTTIIDDITLAALSGRDILALVGARAVTENRDALVVYEMRPQASDEERRGQKLGPGNKQDAVTGALLGRKRTLAMVGGN
jgi:hypothetical protein